MISYARQNINQADIDSVIEVLTSDWLTQGPVLAEFENCVASYCGAKYGVATNSATSALHIACKGLGLGVGDTVWVSPNTFVASANCALYCGGDVDFVDINPKTYNMCAAQLETKLVKAQRDGCLPKIVIAVHYAGQPCEMEKIFQLSKRFGFQIIEDASHAIGAEFNGESVGNCSYSDVTIFSFHPVKILTTGEGGVAVTNDQELYEKMNYFRSHGIVNSNSEARPRPSDEIWNYQQIELGFNYRMTDIQAALGLSQMKRISSFLSKRRELAKKYDRELGELPLTRPWQDPNSLSSYHLYPVRLNTDECENSQKEIYKNFHARGIFVNIHYIPVYRHPYYEQLGFKRGYCPEAEKFYQEVIVLPLHPSLTEKQHDKVIDVTRMLLKP